MKKMIEFLKDEGGQTSTEYILLVAVVAVVIFKFKAILQDKLNGLANGVFDKAGGMLNEINSSR